MALETFAGLGLRGELFFGSVCFDYPFQCHCHHLFIPFCSLFGGLLDDAKALVVYLKVSVPLVGNLHGSGVFPAELLDCGFSRCFHGFAGSLLVSG